MENLLSWAIEYLKKKEALRPPLNSLWNITGSRIGKVVNLFIYQ